MLQPTSTSNEMHFMKGVSSLVVYDIIPPKKKYTQNARKSDVGLTNSNLKGPAIPV